MEEIQRKRDKGDGAKDLKKQERERKGQSKAKSLMYLCCLIRCWRRIFIPFAAFKILEGIFSPNIYPYLGTYLSVFLFGYNTKKN